MKDDLRYSPSDCFDNFPFPRDWREHVVLEAKGRAYYERRAAILIENAEGLTKTYNRFHDPDERDPAILELRALHAATLLRLKISAMPGDDRRREVVEQVV